MGFKRSRLFPGAAYPLKQKCMINSVSKEFYEINIPSFDGELKMVPFNLENLEGVPAGFHRTVTEMVSGLPFKRGIAYLTVDGREVEKGSTHRRGGKHIDGNYIPEVCGWGSGGNGWKVGEGGRTLTSEHHRQSYESETGGMLIASTYPACKGWIGNFKGKAKEGGDCSHISELNDGFIMKPNTVYYGNSQFLHESLPIDQTVHRTIIRVTLPMNYPCLEYN